MAKHPPLLSSLNICYFNFFKILIHSPEDHLLLLHPLDLSCRALLFVRISGAAKRRPVLVRMNPASTTIQPACNQTPNSLLPLGPSTWFAEQISCNSSPPELLIVDIHSEEQKQLFIGADRSGNKNLTVVDMAYSSVPFTQT
jgi:hypothetical protein